MKIFFWLMILIFSSIANAQWGLSIASGYGAAQLVPIRVGIQKTLQKQWRTQSAWPISGYCEGSFYAMNRRQKPPVGNSPQSLKAAAFAGVLRMQRAQPWHRVHPYVELGLGLSYLNHSRIGSRDLGIHFQFEDRLGIGLRFGEAHQYDLGYKAIHFSNAYLGPANHGINLHVFALNYWF
jgi:lipid A 3-O-deacylase